MELSSILTSNQNSRVLDGYGLRIDTCFWWVRTIDGALNPSEIIYSEANNHGIYIPAYTLEQLWSVLPLKIEVENKNFFKEVVTEGVGVRYQGMGRFNFLGDNLADAAAHALIWCIENNYIDVKNLK